MTWSLRLAGLLLVLALAWDALDPGLQPPPFFVLASYVLLGFVFTLAFPWAIWLGVLAAIVVAVGLELLQALVPIRDVRILEILAKWLSATFGVTVALLLLMAARRREPPRS